MELRHNFVTVLLLLTLMTGHYFTSGLQCYNCYSQFRDDGEEVEDSWCREGGALKSSAVINCTRENTLVFRSHVPCSQEINIWTGVSKVEDWSQVPPDQKWIYGCAKIGIVGKYNEQGIVEMQRFCMAVPAEEEDEIQEGCKVTTKKEWDDDDDDDDDWNYWTTVIHGDVGEKEKGCGSSVSDDSVITACFCMGDKCNGGSVSTDKIDL